jgi:hypothetical protein
VNARNDKRRSEVDHLPGVQATKARLTPEKKKRMELELMNDKLKNGDLVTWIPDESPRAYTVEIIKINTGDLLAFVKHHDDDDYLDGSSRWALVSELSPPVLGQTKQD